MDSIEEFKKRIAEDPEFAQGLYEATTKADDDNKDGKDQSSFSDAMTEFTGNLIESTKRTVSEEVDKIVKAAIEEGKKDALSEVSRAFGLTEDAPVMKSEFAELIRKAMLEANDPDKRSIEIEEERDGPPADKTPVLDPVARFKELQEGLHVV